MDVLAPLLSRQPTPGHPTGDTLPTPCDRAPSGKAEGAGRGREQTPGTGPTRSRALEALSGARRPEGAGDRRTDEPPGPPQEAEGRHCHLLKARGLAGGTAPSSRPGFLSRAFHLRDGTAKPAGPAGVRRARSCPSSSSRLGPIWSSTLHPDVPRSSVLTRPPQKEKGRDTQRPGAGSRGSAPARPSSQGPPPVSLGGVPVRTPLGGPEPRTARRGAAAEGHRKRPLSASYTARVRPKRPVPVCAKYRATGALRARASEAEHRANGEPRLTARPARRSPGRERTPAPARSVRPCGSSVK